MKRRIVWGLIVAIITAVAWHGREKKSKGIAGEAALANAIQLVSQVEDYDQHREYIDSMVRRAHQWAFELAHSPGAPGLGGEPDTPATFDEDKYLKLLFFNMPRGIRKDDDKAETTYEIQQNRDIGKALDALRAKLGIKRMVP